MSQRHELERLFVFDSKRRELVQQALTGAAFSSDDAVTLAVDDR